MHVGYAFTRKIFNKCEDVILLDMNKNIMKFSIVDDEEEFSAIARLIELGRQKSYVTIDDILHFFPEAEQDVEQLEEAFAALMSAGIPYMEDVSAENLQMKTLKMKSKKWTKTAMRCPIWMIWQILIQTIRSACT